MEVSLGVQGAGCEVILCDGLIGQRGFLQENRCPGSAATQQSTQKPRLTLT